MNWSRKCRGYAPLMRRFRSAPPKLLLQGCSMEGHFPHHPMGLHRATPSLPSEVRNLHRKIRVLQHRTADFDSCDSTFRSAAISINSASFLRLLSSSFLTSLAPSSLFFFFLFLSAESHMNRKWYNISMSPPRIQGIGVACQRRAQWHTSPSCHELPCEITLDLTSWLAEGGAFHRTES